jgi:hypothetical protein
MMTRGINNPAKSPTVVIFDRNDLSGTCHDGAFTDDMRIVNDKQHSDRASAQRLGAEILVRDRFLGDPEFRAVEGESGDAAAGDAIGLDRSEGSLVEFHGFGPVPHAQSCGDKRCDVRTHRRVGHQKKEYSAEKIFTSSIEKQFVGWGIFVGRLIIQYGQKSIETLVAPDLPLSYSIGYTYCNSMDGSAAV